MSEKEGRVNFLKARLAVAQKDWEKANEKWIKSSSLNCENAITANIKVKNSMTKMAFLNGQRKLLSELISLETKEKPQP
jgi:hypothetical protein